jgi:hypothetical protein
MHVTLWKITLQSYQVVHSWSAKRRVEDLASSSSRAILARCSTSAVSRVARARMLSEVMKGSNPAKQHQQTLISAVSSKVPLKFGS